MNPKKGPFNSRVNKVDESREIDGVAQTIDAEIKSDQDQAARRSLQKSGRFYETLSKIFGRTNEKEELSPGKSFNLDRLGSRDS